MTLAELYTTNYLPSLRLVRYLDRMMQQNDEMRQSDGAWLERVKRVYGTERIDLDEIRESESRHSVEMGE